jgi:hypothetical protein
MAAALAGVLAGLIFVPVAHAAPPSQESPIRCGETTLTIERDGVVLFELPAQAGERAQIDPEATMTLKVENIPARGHVDLIVRLPFGQQVTRTFSWEGMVEGSDHVETFGPEDYGEYANLVRGAYPLEVNIFAGDAPLCSVPFEVRVGEAGIQGPIATAAAAASGVAAAGAVAVAGWAAASTAATSAASSAASGAASSATSGAMTPELKLKVSIERRRRRGWRRWVPLPSWKKTLIGTILGTLTGILLSLTLQQGGFESLTSFTLIRNAVVGAFTSVGFGVAWGSVLGFIRKPVDEEDVEARKGAPPPITGSKN